jgi:hypothetical protein
MVLVWWWCDAAGFFLSNLRLHSGGRDPFGHGAAAPPAGLRGRGRLPPSVVRLVSVGVDLLRLVSDLLLLPLRFFFFSILRFFLSSLTPPR